MHSQISVKYQNTQGNQVNRSDTHVVAVNKGSNGHMPIFVSPISSQKGGVIKCTVHHFFNCRYLIHQQQQLHAIKGDDISLDKLGNSSSNTLFLFQCLKHFRINTASRLLNCVITRNTLILHGKIDKENFEIYQ